MKIMVAIDGSEHSKRVISQAVKYAEAFKSDVTIFHVSGETLSKPQVSMYFSGEKLAAVKKDLEQEAKKMVDAMLEPFKVKGIPVNAVIELGDSPADSINNEVVKNKYDLLIIGSRGLRGMKELFLGSVSNRVAHQVETDILIVK
ncbi:MAG: universal stress protein [Dethiobacter sp.]|jgi:nucleotide-binding universal stress UspA family protein|nr:universal stress protein [Dethiobacter sp.]